MNYLKIRVLIINAVHSYQYLLHPKSQAAYLQYQLPATMKSISCCPCLGASWKYWIGLWDIEFRTKWTILDQAISESSYLLAYIHQRPGLNIHFWKQVSKSIMDHNGYLGISSHCVWSYWTKFIEIHDKRWFVWCLKNILYYC